MKNKIIMRFLNNVLRLSFFIITIGGYAQTKYGVTTGLNMSRFNNEFNTFGGTYFNTNSIGLKLGVFAEFPINNNLLFTPKIIYNQMGDREKDFDVVTPQRLNTSTIDYKLDYISIPLNVRFFNKLYLEIGPQIGILVSEKSESLDLGSPKSTLDLGANFELGYQLQNFRVSINAYHGFTNLFEIEEDQPLINKDLSVRNFTLSLNLGYIVF